MAKYSKRTCNRCGVRDIQPNMVRQTVTRKVGSSRQSVDGGTILGAMAGNKASHRQIQKTLFANNKRSYKRNYQVWMCQGCADKTEKENSSSDFFEEFGSAFWYIILLGGAFLYYIA